MQAAPEYVRRRFRLPLRFWARFIIETLTTRSFSRLVNARLHGEKCCIEGLNNLPSHGNFVLAVNHFNGRAALDVGAAVLQAAAKARPDALDSMLIVIGTRPRKASQVARILDWLYKRWSYHTVRILIHNAQASLAGLREWRKRDQPIFVFPEGRGQLELGQIRQGAGKWLSLLGKPVIPVAVWWHQETGWHVVFGEVIVWSHRSELRDVQLGLALATLLPPELTSAWQDELHRWREVHDTQPHNEPF